MLLHVSFLVIPCRVVYCRMDGWNSTPSDEGVDGVREGDGDSEIEGHSLIEVHHVDLVVNSVCGSSVLTCLRWFLSAPPAGERLDRFARSVPFPVMVATTTTTWLEIEARQQYETRELGRRERSAARLLRARYYFRATYKRWNHQIASCLGYFQRGL
ncbi:hypothetical protein V8F06_006380 [Rhypophila decipiens]